MRTPGPRLPGPGPEPGDSAAHPDGQVLGGDSLLVRYLNLVKFPHTLFALPFALLVGACSGSGGASPSAAAPATPAPSVGVSEAPPASEPAASASAPAASASAPAAGVTTIALADSALGSIIVDAEGRTLYAFTNDVGGVSTCYDDCATAWPPLIASDDMRSTKVEAEVNAFIRQNAPVETRRKSPGVGEHTVEIMREVGYSDAEIADLKNAKAIASP